MREGGREREIDRERERAKNEMQWDKMKAGKKGVNVQKFTPISRN